jgi:hypothetical protein
MAQLEFLSTAPCIGEILEHLVRSRAVPGDGGDGDEHQNYRNTSLHFSRPAA